MHTLGRITFLLGCSIVFLIGCAIESPDSIAPESPVSAAAVSESTPRPTVVLATGTPAATASAVPVPIITAVPTTQSTLSATSAPLSQPTYLLAVRPELFETTSSAIATLIQGSSNVRWHVVSAQDPGALLSNGEADAALVPSTEGASVLERKLVLAVPFTTDWENVTESEAQEIIDNGHPLVTVKYWSDMGDPDAINRARLRPLSVDGMLPHEPGYPLSEIWSILSAPGRQPEVAQLSNGLQAAMGADQVVMLAAVGDIMLARTLGNTLNQNDVTYPFQLVEATLGSADITIGNLESSLGNIGEPANKRYTFQSPPEAALALAQAGFDIISMANNHALDYGPDALLQGMSLLGEQDLVVVGAGADEKQTRQAHVQQVGGLRLAFLGYVNVPVEVGGFDTATWAASENAPGLAWGDPATITENVTAASATADIVIVILHSGYEYVEAPSEEQVAAAHAAIDAGATLVIGHHAHILQGIEFYQDGVIVYGLGNFAFDITGPKESAIFQLWLDKQGVRQLNLVPTIVQIGGRPRLAEPWEAAPIRRQVYHLTNLLNAP